MPASRQTASPATAPAAGRNFAAIALAYPRLSNTAFTVTNWSISPDFGVPVSVREENEDMYAWTVDDEIDRGATQAIDQAEMIPEVAGSALTAGTAGSAGAISSGGISYTPAQIKQLEDRLDALEP